MRRILILGKDSYIGESLYVWFERFMDKYETCIASTLDYEWKKVDFSLYDTVIDLAGIAHINKIKPEMKDLFYSVNRDLTIEIGKHAKEHGVTHFIYFSSMNVYGDYCENISNREDTNPSSFYGDSKLQGDLGLRRLEDDDFVVAHLRPPFVYGKDCKGNYNVIRKITAKIPVFPTYKNKKSMIYIDNLCEFVRMVVDNRMDGYLTPQNKELVSTGDLIREIAKQSGKKICFTDIFNWLIPVVKKTRIGKKAFADDYYPIELSSYYGFEYCIVDFAESIRRSEGV